jgi:hypothetical protein
MKYNSNANDQNQNRTSQKQIESIEQHKEIHRPEFMSSKNMLNSQIIEMRGEGNMQKSKKYLLPCKNFLVEEKEDTSIF